ncbi:MAG: twitch domain-containing radical SAM protein, partial [Oligoflexia bacterium]|nr:twitch domain-containing radical SAM protein [Oligoflexia bacterium]
TFCVLPWLHMATRTWGSVTPCCVGEPLSENLNRGTFSSAWNSPSMKQLRTAMLKGHSSNICKRCYEEEKASIASHRVRSNSYWKDYYSFNQFIEQTDKDGFFKGKAIYLDMRYGNKCNLECTMCTPQEAVRWGPLSKKIQDNASSFFVRRYFKDHQSFMKTAPSKLWYEREEVKEDIYKQIPHLKRVTIAGGEPLLIKEHYDFLDECIRQKSAHRISLHYHTNGTALGTDLFDKWRHFESVMVFISLDDIKERNYYIRYPCPWDKIEKNLELIDKKSPKNVHPMILCTIQIKNIFYFNEFLNYLMDKKFKKVHAYYEDLVHTEVVHHPVFLNCQVLPKNVKEMVSKKFEDIYKKFPAKTDRLKTIVNFMNQEDKSDLIPAFKDFVKALDKARGTNFCKTFPELSELLRFNS